ncbi:MAG: hypothetical protein E6H65_03865 [Betaproteobacteria bacterium]|nr:MAG: hypothetical protein E6H65_03865 [Betaproteobacteria bacterium]
MRWKLLRRRLSISAPRMIVRSHLPWPLRWALIAVVLGFSAAIAMWAFEFGKDIAGLDRNATAELAKLRAEVAQLQDEREKAAQDRLGQQMKQIETENLALKGDLGFFERLLPAGASQGVSIRSLQAEAKAPGKVRYQLLVLQAGKTLPEFRGNYEVTLSGTLDGKPWSLAAAGGPKPLQMKQYLRVEGMIDHPVQAVVKNIQVRVMDASGGVKATQTAKV